MKIFKYIILFMVLAAMVFPLFWMFRVSFLPLASDLGWTDLLSGKWDIGAYGDIMSSLGMMRYFFNSVLVGGIVVLGNILFCFMSGYAFSRYKFIGKNFWFYSMIGVLMIPAHVIIIPLYLMMRQTGLYDTYWALILPFLVNPMGIFLVRQYVDSLPRSMEEAARIDGASEFTILFKIIMPLCKPALAVLAIQTFLTNWNSFLYPFILTSSEAVRTLPVALALYQGHQAIDWPHLMAGSSLAVIPVLLVFLFFQKHIISGITAGALKQ